MVSKIVSFSSGKKQPPLSSLMIDTLIAACAKQNHGIAFGPGDIKGSFTALIKRGLIINREVTHHQRTESLWQVTIEAVEMLKELGIEVSC